MAKLYSTGPVENAAANAAISTWVKVLNNNRNKEVTADITVYSLNGNKKTLFSVSLIIPPNSNEYEVFDITGILQYEVQILLSQNDNVLVSVWGKDADANLLASHRFVPSELTLLSTSTIPKTTSKNKVPKSRPSSRRRTS
ncbi:hypothetical protein [Syntrophomonas erecta]